MKLVNFRRLKSAVGHDYVNENEVQIEVQSPTNKDKIYLLRSFKLATNLLLQRVVVDYELAADGATKTIRVIEKRCLDIRAEP